MKAHPIFRPPLRTRSLPLPPYLESISEERTIDEGSRRNVHSFISLKDSTTTDASGTRPLNAVLKRTGPPQNKKSGIKLRIRTSIYKVDRDCSICFGSAIRPVRTRCCGSLFCEEHLNDWLKGSSNLCPICSASCHLHSDTISLASPMSPTVFQTHTSSPLAVSPPLHCPTPRSWSSGSSAVFSDAAPWRTPDAAAYPQSPGLVHNRSEIRHEGDFAYPYSPPAIASEMLEPALVLSPLSWRSCGSTSSFQSDTHTESRCSSSFSYHPCFFPCPNSLNHFETDELKFEFCLRQMIGQVLIVVGMIVVFHILLSKKSGFD
ncbi:hypothetical protein D9757_010939 [Collybiopsis confluens]|uniref:RING-type domain-containing protein n=1 Tax=Collybiopsis confluens TaxID=2823264 RepID=A0A8H5GJJ3_9AGAR|nr:hypothetical protein D9757_010939 [Collybiopsis confluens]